MANFGLLGFDFKALEVDPEPLGVDICSLRVNLGPLGVDLGPLGVKFEPQAVDFQHTRIEFRFSQSILASWRRFWASSSNFKPLRVDKSLGISSGGWFWALRGLFYAYEGWFRVSMSQYLVLECEFGDFRLLVLFMISCNAFSHNSCVLREARWVPLPPSAQSCIIYFFLYPSLYFNTFYREIQCVFAILSQKSMRFTFWNKNKGFFSNH